MRFTSSLVAVTLVAACGSSKDADRDANNPEGPSAPVVSVDNQGLTGALYFATPGAFAELDIASGIRVHMRFDGGGRPSLDGSEFVGSISDRAELLEPDAYNTELIITERDGRTVARFGRADFIYGPRLSPDRQHIAFEYHSIDDGDPAGVDILNISDRTGNVIGRYSGAGWWDWAPDGSLFVTRGDTIYRIGADFGDGSPVKQFANDIPTDLAVSPDGTKLAFGLGDRDLLANHLYVMNVDGSGVRQLTTSNLNEDGPAWSPDGKTIAVRQGIAYAGLSAGIPGGSCPEVWLIPSSSDTLALSSANERYKMQMLEDGAKRGVCAFSGLSWRAPAPYDRNNGTPITGNGANHGLAGTIVYDAPSNVVAVDLASGTQRTWTDKGGSPDVSRDGTELLIRADEPDSGDVDDDQVTLLDAGGRVTGGVMVTGSFLGVPRLSYDAQRIAVRFSGESDGADWFISIFDRDANLLNRFPARYEGFTWTPDGRMVAIAGNQMAITDAAFTQLTSLATFGDVVGGAAVSPDGARLAFTMNGHVWLMNADGSDVHQLTISSASESSPEWSPDGTRILLRYDDACPQVFVVPADATRVFVGNPSVETTAVAIMHEEDNRSRTTCAFSRANWRP